MIRTDHNCNLEAFGIVGMEAMLGDYTGFILCCGCRVRVSGKEMLVTMPSGKDRRVFGVDGGTGLFEVLTNRLAEHVDACPTFACALAVQEAVGGQVFVFALAREQAKAARG